MNLKVLGRHVLAVLAGAVAGMLAVTAVQAVGHAIYPVVNFEGADAAALEKLIAALPVGALLFVVLAWLAGGLLGGYTATCIAPGRSLMPAITVGMFLLAATAATLFAVPHPVWMTVAGFIVPLPAALAGGWAGRRLMTWRSDRQL